MLRRLIRYMTLSTGYDLHLEDPEDFRAACRAVRDRHLVLDGMLDGDRES